jgi:hypothetical protein
VYTIPIDIAMFENPVDRHVPNECAVNRDNDRIHQTAEHRFVTSVSWVGVENSRSQPDHWHWFSVGSIKGASV